MTSSRRVVLLRDGRWPSVPGVCCWRHSLHAAGTAAGVRVQEVTCVPPPAPVPASPPPRLPAGAVAVDQPARRLAWLPSMIRRPLALVYRHLRATVAGRPRAAAQRRRPSTAPPRLDGATLVIAESPEAAVLAVASGAPGRRVWALALPAEPLETGDPVGEAGALAGAAPRIGGFLVDSELARESVERSLAGLRPRVEIFPPLAVDRPCPACAALDDDPPGALPTMVAQLAAWRGMLTQLRQGRSPGGRPAWRARLCGGAWVPAPRSSWDGLSGVPSLGHADTEPTAWTAQAQERAFRTVLDAVAAQPPATPRPTRKALLAGHDLKFARDLGERLDRRTDLAVTVDDWPALGYRTAQTLTRLRHADSIFAEWARTSAVWLSRHKRPDQFLAIRLHRFELDSPYPRDIQIDNVDAVVYIAPRFGRRIRGELGWPAEKLVYIPNFLDLDWLDRPKLPETRFTLGFVGIEWARKRFDLALDLLAAARREDPRFRLVVRSVLPWHNEFAWAMPQEREYTTWCFDRIERDPLLRGGVFFDPPGRDMARWFRRIGHILSTSDEEGCHTAVAEGMASGAVPIVRPWPGAVEIYDKEWVHESTDGAVAALLESAARDVWRERAARAKAEIRRTHDPVAVVDAWADLLHADVTAARRYFAEYANLAGTASACG